MGKKVGRAVIIFGICNVMQKSIQYILMPILTRILTTDDYGVYSLYLSWITILTVVATLNLHLGGFNNGMEKYSEKRNDYTASIIVLSCILIVVTYVVIKILNVLNINIIHMSDELINLMFIHLIFQQGINCWVARQRYEYNFKDLLEKIIIFAIASIVFPVCTLRWTTNNLTIIILMIELPVCIFGTYCIYTSLSNGKRNSIKIYWKEALHFNTPLIPHYIAGVILNQIDRLMIQSMCGNSAAGIYSVAYSLSSALNLVVSSVNSAFVPFVYDSIKKHKDINKMMKGILHILLLAILIFTLIAPEIMNIVFPSQYQKAVIAIPPVILSTFFMFLYNMFANVEFYYEKKYFISIASVLAAVANIILNYICIPYFGFCVAGYTTVICYILYALAHCLNVIKIEKNYEIKIYNYKDILVISFAAILSVSVAALFYNNIAIRYIFLWLLVCLL